MKKILLSAFLVTSLVAFNANAEEKHTGIKSQATEDITIKVNPDKFTSTIEFKVTDFSEKNAQLKLNKEVKQALDIVKKHKNVKHSLSSFRSHQEYRTKATVATQSITLDSLDKNLVEKITTDLQQKSGVVKATGSYLSDELNKKHFEELFAKAYKLAHDKAKFIVKTTNGKDLKITNISYYLNNRRDIVPYRAVKSMAMTEEAAPMVNVDDSEKNVTLNLTLSFEFQQ